MHVYIPCWGCNFHPYGGVHIPTSLAGDETESGDRVDFHLPFESKEDDQTRRWRMDASDRKTRVVVMDH